MPKEVALRCLLVAAALVGCKPTPPGEALADGGPLEPPWDPESLVDPFSGDCQPACVRGTFCTRSGRCASAGPTACPLPCPQAQACGPWQPGCTPAACAVPGPWPRGVMKLFVLQLSRAGTGCDLDGDGDVDNALGPLLGVVPTLQAKIEESVQVGRTVAALELGPTGSAALWFGSVDPRQARCNPAVADAVCAYTASPLSFDRQGSCEPWLRWPSDAGGVDGGVLALATESSEALVPLEDTAVLLRVAVPRVRAASRWDADAGRLGGLSGGRLCAAVLPGQLRLALAGLPQSTLDAFGGLDTARSLFDALVHADLDLDRDGRAEHVSVSLDFEATFAWATGMTPP